MARPSKYSLELVTKICDRMATSERGLARICREDKDVPCSSTVNKWLASGDYPEFNERIKKVRIKTIPKRKTFGEKSSGFDDYRIKNANTSNAKRFPNGYIYILNIENTDYYKFGVSQNPSRRIRDLSNATPFILNLIFSCSFLNVYNIESRIHKRIKDFYVKSEWFKMEKALVNNIIEDLKLLSIVDQVDGKGN